MMQRDLTPYDDAWTDQAPAGAEQESVNPLKLLHQCLRGRYALAALLAVILAVPCAVLGYMALPPKYTSVGRVTIHPSKTQLLYPTEMTEVMTAFDSYVQSQANTLRGSRVLDLALQDPELAKAGWPPAPEGSIELFRSLQVDAAPRSQDIFVRVSNEEPRKAKAAVNAILTAYEQIAIDNANVELTDRMKRLRELREEFERQSRSKRDEAIRIAENEGTDDLARRRDAKHAQWQEIDDIIQTYLVEMAKRGIDPDAPAGAAQSQGEQDPQDIDPALLAQNDRELAALLQQRDRMRLELDSLRTRYAESHRAVQSLVQDLEVAETKIGARVQTLLGMGAGAQLVGETSGDYAGRVRGELARLRRLANEVGAEAKRLGTLQLRIENYKDDAARADEQFKLADERLQALEVESRAGNIGRIEITQRGSQPLLPSTDRRIPLAVIGGLGGSALGVGLVALLGIVFPKYRYIGDLNAGAGNVFVFGAVPELDPANPESRELVAASVAQVRSVIDARLLGIAERAAVHLITSAGAAEGKSTIALRLSKSFAATGRKTLLIDSDMVGQRLSAEFGMRAEPGFAEAVTGAVAPADAVHETPIRDLFIMPCGRTERVDPEQISARRVEQMLSEVRDDYQTVVVDSGPVLGSLEAQAVASVADEVMLVITRGREVRQVKLAVDRLHRLGARKIGVVFNRATREDVERSTSVSVTSQRTADVRSTRNGDNHANGFHDALSMEVSDREEV